VFIGHSDAYAAKEADICKAINQLINRGVHTFLNGGMGVFDMKCATCVNRLKKYYPQVKHYLVIPYLNFNRCDRSLFDGSIYPELEKYHFKAAIVKRNEWMVDNSAYAICYINREWGGAIKTYKYAQKQQLIITNLNSY